MSAESPASRCLIPQMPMRHDSECEPAILKQGDLLPGYHTGYTIKAICVRPRDKNDFIIHSPSAEPKHCLKSLPLMGLEVQTCNPVRMKQED